MWSEQKANTNKKYLSRKNDLTKKNQTKILKSQPPSKNQHNTENTHDSIWKKIHIRILLLLKINFDIDHFHMGHIQSIDTSQSKPFESENPVPPLMAQDFKSPYLQSSHLLFSSQNFEEGVKNKKVRCRGEFQLQFSVSITLMPVKLLEIKELHIIPPKIPSKSYQFHSYLHNWKLHIVIYIIQNVFGALFFIQKTPMNGLRPSYHALYSQ